VRPGTGNASAASFDLWLSTRSLTVRGASSPSIDWLGARVEGLATDRPFTINTSKDPHWQTGARIERRATSRLAFSASAIAGRGRQGAAVNTTELGSGRDLSVTTPFAGPDSYRTVFDTNLGVSVYLKQTGRLHVKAIGEIWNPFMGSFINAGTATRDVDRTRTLKFGLAFVF